MSMLHLRTTASIRSVIDFPGLHFSVSLELKYRSGFGEFFSLFLTDAWDL